MSQSASTIDYYWIEIVDNKKGWNLVTLEALNEFIYWSTDAVKLIRRCWHQLLWSLTEDNLAIKQFVVAI